MKYYLPFLFIGLLFASCGANRNISNKLTQSLSNQAVIEKQLQDLARQINEQREQELKKGDIEETISATIEEKTTVVEKKSLTRYDELKILLDSIKLLYKDSVANRAELDKKIKRSVTAIESGVMMVKSETREMEMIKNYLGETTMNRFNSAQFFPTGGFKIPEDFIPKAEAAFAPVLDQVIAFVKKHPGKDLIATIITRGYADETPVGKNSPMYPKLKEMSGSETPTSQAMNKALSYLRAEEMGNLVRSMLVKRKNLDVDLQRIQITLMVEGRGEEYPNPAIKNYKPNDERRRIVAFYWSVLTQS
jgi:outer membrane protein OmpA-like peptidoglycan-associated protein